MLIQIEINTTCNFKCFYCYGRSIPQVVMDFDTFIGIMNGLPTGKHTINLQGEGEPTLHPQFWDMVALVKAKGHNPYTITNGNAINTDNIKENFTSIGISLDTLDATEATRIGRFNLPKVIANFESLVTCMGADNVTVMTVNYGQKLLPLINYVKFNGIKNHIIQPLQTKDDYAKSHSTSEAVKCYTYSCDILNKRIMLSYGVSGIVKPCCFIKDESQYVSIADLKATLKAKRVPPSCAGCKQIISH